MQDLTESSDQLNVEPVLELRASGKTHRRSELGRRGGLNRQVQPPCAEAGQVPLPALLHRPVESHMDYPHLTLHQRHQTAAPYKAGLLKRGIAGALACQPSTIGRALHRNCSGAAYVGSVARGGSQAPPTCRQLTSHERVVGWMSVVASDRSVGLVLHRSWIHADSSRPHGRRDWRHANTAPPPPDDRPAIGDWAGRRGWQSDCSVCDCPSLEDWTMDELKAVMREAVEAALEGDLDALLIARMLLRHLQLQLHRRLGDGAAG